MRRTWLLVAAALVVIAAIVVAVVLVRNSKSESTPSTTEWAGQVCTSLDKWRTSITSLSSISGIPTQDEMRKKLTDAQVATEQLVTDLKNIGPPETTSGMQLKQELEKQGDQLQQSYEKVKTGAQSAVNNASGTADLLRRLAAVLPDFQKLLNEISTTMDTLQNSNVAGDSADEVREGFENADACKKLRSEQD